MEVDYDGDVMTLNMGPQHPSTHGVLRLELKTDGEVVAEAIPHIGYLHRCFEKLAENVEYPGVIPFTDRMDYLASMSNNLAYVMSVEKLGGIKVTERCEYIRIIMAELQRIASHLIAVGAFLNDCGAFMTPVLYMLREREKILDLFEMVSGQRLTYTYMRVGGVSQDIPEEFLPALDKFLREMPGWIDEYEQLLKENEILLARAKGVGILSRELAINISASGPVLRASGIKWDIRRADPYSIYDRFDFDVAVRTHGDLMDNYLIRLDEIRQSLRILQQAVKQIPEGPVMTGKPQYQVRVPAGEAYGRVEAPKGELAYYVVSNGKPNPWRYHVRPPSFVNITALEQMCIGTKIADFVAILGVIDIVLGELDR